MHSANSILIVFDDGRADLGPLGDLRPVFDQRTGVFTVREWLAGRHRVVVEREVHGVAAAGMEALAIERGAPACDTVLAADANATTIAVNGRLLGDRAALLARLLERDGDVVARAPDGSIAAFRARAGTAIRLLDALRAGEDVDGFDDGEVLEASDAVLFTRPWHLLDHLDAQLRIDAASLGDAPGFGGAPAGQASGPVTHGEHAIRVHQSVTFGAHVVFDASAGPIVIADGVRIGHHAILHGPCCIGRDSIVADRTILKANAVIGPVCRAAGEIGSTIMQGFSNKAHDGHLGDALLGEWVNIGAGSDNSNLLNTYGEVVATLEAGGQRERTGRTFFGCVLGDHVKLAIGTRLMTGSVVGTGSMWAASTPITGTLPRFSWVTDDGRRDYRFAKFLAVAEAAMARRKQPVGDALRARLRELAG